MDTVIYRVLKNEVELRDFEYDHEVDDYLCKFSDNELQKEIRVQIVLQETESSGGNYHEPESTWVSREDVDEEMSGWHFLGRFEKLSREETI